MHDPASDGVSLSDKQGLPRQHVLELAARIISAYLSNNSVPCAEVPQLIHQVCNSLLQADEGPRPRLRPAVPVNRSVFPDYIVCLENGRRLKTLRRHLMSAFGLTPEQYRRRWGLPADYPMIAPNYAADRSGLAKVTGLGHGPAKPRRKAGKDG